ncbi:hypothetical protein BVX94_00775 [bacterium B17]|nr:hypothetical protein BVX94_00775 [bacterium B17]
MNKDFATIILTAYLAGEINAPKQRYLERLNIALQKYNLKLLLIDLAGKKIDTTCDQLILPEEMVKGNGTLTNEQEKILANIPILQQALTTEAEFYRLDHKTAGNRTLRLADYIFQQTRTTPNVVLFIIWHQFNGVSMTLRWLCETNNTPFMYAHLGLLPGTIVFDIDGQMGESWVARDSEKFLSMPISDDDLEQAKHYLNFVCCKKLTRKPQQASVPIENLLEPHRKQNRKIAFYAGQNDYRAGILPNTLTNKELHSPFYTSTMDALDHLNELAAKNDWLILFKPHPNTKNKIDYSSALKMKRVIYAPDTDVLECIKVSDVVVTILSGTSYEALTHKKPVVLLGKTQLSGKHCVYEIENKNDTEQRIKEALQKGFTLQQNDKWEKCATQLLKHYLFAFNEETSQLIARDVDDASSFIAKSL